MMIRTTMCVMKVDEDGIKLAGCWPAKWLQCLMELTVTWTVLLYWLGDSDEATGLVRLDGDDGDGPVDCERSLTVGRAGLGCVCGRHQCPLQVGEGAGLMPPSRRLLLCLQIFRARRKNSGNAFIFPHYPACKSSVFPGKRKLTIRSFKVQIELWS